jgi:hypothetical protein
MNLRPLKEILAMSKEKIDEALAPIRARQIKAKAELEMARLEETLASGESKVLEMCTQKDINFEKLLDQLDEIALTERRLEQYKSVLVQLFPVEAV